MWALSRLMGILSMTAVLILPAAAFALSAGQVDTFEDGTTQNWEIGLLGAPHPAPPTIVPGGGPAGAGDRFLLVTSIAAEVSGNRLAVFNQTRWSGDYLAAGLGAITMEVKNLGATDLFLRLVLSNPFPVGPPTTANRAISKDPVFLPAGSDWTRVEFPVALSDLVAQKGTVEGALANVGELKIIHNPAATFPPPLVDAQLGVDNITAIATTAMVGEAGGVENRTVTPEDLLSLHLNIGNIRGAPPDQIAQEWFFVGFGPISTGIVANLFFVTPQGAAVSLEQAMNDPGAATFNFNHGRNTYFIGNFVLGQAGITSGNFMIYGYAFSTTPVADFRNAPDLVIENVVSLNVQ